MISAQAEIILRLLEAGTDGNWPQVRDDVLARGYSPEEVSSAWKALEQEAGMIGLAPGPENFE